VSIFDVTGSNFKKPFKSTLPITETDAEPACGGYSPCICKVPDNIVLPTKVLEPVVNKLPVTV